MVYIEISYRIILLKYDPPYGFWDTDTRGPRGMASSAPVWTPSTGRSGSWRTLLVLSQVISVLILPHVVRNWASDCDADVTHASSSRYFKSQVLRWDELDSTDTTQQRCVGRHSQSCESDVTDSEWWNSGDFISRKNGTSGNVPW